MKRKLLLGMLTAAGALCLSLGLAACGGKGDGQVELSFEYDGERKAYAVTGLTDLPTESEAEKDPTLRPTELTVPAEHRGDPVYIAEGAFAGYGFLKSVSLEAGVLSIGDNAFAGCAALTSVNFPAGLTSVGKGAFANCTNLAALAFPASLVEVGEAAFTGCTALAAVTVDAQNAAFTAVGNILYNKAQTEIVHVPAALKGEVTLPATLGEVPVSAFNNCGLVTKVTVASAQTIGANAFADCGALKEVILPKTGLGSIGAGAFANCTALEGISLPAGLGRIGAGAFENCDKLTAINIPDVPADADTVPTVGARAFASCDGLTSATLPQGLTKIPDGLFAECGKLATADIPANVTEIGSYAFSDCASLSAVTIPASVVSIGERAFFGCSGVTGFTADNNTAYAVVDGCLIEKATGILLYGCNAANKTITLSDSVKKIAPYAFRFMDEIASITLPAGVEEIGEGAFLGCAALRTIAISGNSEKFFTKDGVLYTVGSKRVDGETKTVYSFLFVPVALQGSVAIPAGVESIPASTFEHRKNLVTVTIPAGVASIGNSAFAHCTKLSSVTIPQDVTTIGANAFAYCTSLGSFEVPDGTKDTALANYVLMGCTALTTVKLGDRVSTVNANVFEGCTALATIEVSAANMRYKSANGILYSLRTSGGNTTVTGIVHVPMQVSGAIEILAGFDSIVAEAFYGRTQITSVTIPADIKTIGSHAFYGCTGLTAAHYAGDAAAWAKVNVANGNEPLTTVLSVEGAAG